MTSLTGIITVHLADGTKVIVPDSLEDLTSYVLHEQGDWFEDEIKFLRRMLQPRATVLDIGANHGVYALSLARKIGPPGQLWAFEPAADTARLLSKSAAINGTYWLHVVQKALSDRQGTAWLQMPGQSELNSLANVEATEVVRGEACHVTTLDACLEEYKWVAVDLLKIDAEGEEERILRGGARFFNELSPLVMFEVKADTAFHLELVDRFKALGYYCFRLIPGLDALAPFDADQGIDDYQLNLFAAKPDRVETLAAAGWLVEQTDVHELDPGLEQQASWVSVLRDQPYAQVLMPDWQAWEDQVGRGEIHRALEAWALALDCNAPITRRYHALKQSYSLLQQICQPGCPASRWGSLGRVALAIGERRQSIEAFNTMHMDLSSGKATGLDEPFLCPDPGFEHVNPADRLEAWLEAADLSAMEQVGSFSGFFTGETARPRLERFANLGFKHDPMQRRMELLQARLGDSEEQLENSDSDPVRDWFNFLELDRPLRCIDVGVLGLADNPVPWVRWAEEGCAEVLGFEPLQLECDQLNDQTTKAGVAIRHLPWALGDGKEHTLHITNAPMASSLFPPARPTVDMFPSLGDLMQVVKKENVRTHRLDEVEEANSADFLNLRTQGTELMILENAREVLKSVSVIQCEVEFIELYEGQPLMADVDTFLRSQGFCFLKYACTTGRPLQPLQHTGKPHEAISQVLRGDAIYVRDFRALSKWSNHQLRAAAFVLHSLYDAFDLTALILSELDLRDENSLASSYLVALSITNPDLQSCEA
jgi:FkbM family methyltransferase